jgi:hypothetical protein
VRAVAYRRKRILRHLYVAALAFNVFWLIGSLALGLFDENSFLPANSLRHLAYPYYGASPRESRFVGLALHELYGAPRLLTSEEVLSYLFEVEDISYHARDVTLELVDDPAALLTSPPTGSAERYTIGVEGEDKEVVFFLPPSGDGGPWTVVAVREGERVLFVPLAVEGE